MCNFKNLEKICQKLLATLVCGILMIFWLVNIEITTGYFNVILIQSVVASRSWSNNIEIGLNIAHTQDTCDNFGMIKSLNISEDSGQFRKAQVILNS